MFNYWCRHHNFLLKCWENPTRVHTTYARIATRTRSNRAITALILLRRNVNWTVQGVQYSFGTILLFFAYITCYMAISVHGRGAFRLRATAAIGKPNIIIAIFSAGAFICTRRGYFCQTGICTWPIRTSNTDFTSIPMQGIPANLIFTKFCN